MKVKLLKIASVVLLISWTSVFVTYLIDTSCSSLRDMIPYFIIMPIIVSVLLFAAFIMHKIID